MSTLNERARDLWAKLQQSSLPERDLRDALAAHAADAVERERAAYADPADVGEAVDVACEAVDVLYGIAELAGCGPDENIVNGVRRWAERIKADARREAFGEVKAALRQLQREYIDLDCKSAVAAAQNRIRALDERETPDGV